MSAQPISPITRVGIVAKSHLRAAIPHLTDIADWLAKRNVEALFETATAELVTANGYVSADKAAIASGVDMVLILGGDGTLLSMADAIAEAGSKVPILGVNFGSLGFLTEVTLPELFSSLDAAIAGRAHVETRLMIRATTRRGGLPFAQQMALNDAVVSKGTRARMIQLSVSVGEEFVTRVRADGLIIATPTGSTAYNLAVGGPIVHPSVDALVLTPIAPHTLTNRPIVIPSTWAVNVQPIMDDRDEVHISFDGQTGFQLQSGDDITVKRADEPLRLIKPSTRSYFEVLRTKLKWGER